MEHKKEGLSRPCSANDIFISSNGLQCGNCLSMIGKETKIKPIRGTFGCANCLWASCECTNRSKYKAKEGMPEYSDNSCNSYVYFD
jgi:hypothetical protein